VESLGPGVFGGQCSGSFSSKRSGDQGSGSLLDVCISILLLVVMVVLRFSSVHPKKEICIWADSGTYTL